MDSAVWCDNVSLDVRRPRVTKRRNKSVEMGEREQLPGLAITGSEKNGDTDNMYPMYFGVSCAFFALQALSNPYVEVERWSEIRDNMLQGSAKLLGLLVWKAQKEGSNGGGDCNIYNKLRVAEREIEHLKRMRHEDAKANEKVVGIFAAQEQSWLSERKKLRQQIGALMNELRVFEKKKGEVISGLNHKLKEMENLVESKDKALKEEEQKRKEIEEKLTKAERDKEELRELANRKAQEHSSELRKHKTAFIELVSNQRQLEAELGRAAKQVEATKQELGSVLEQKDESELLAQKLSMEIAKLHKDFEQKDKILSGMLRKSKLDTAEKQMLLKEVKLSKARRKQAEQETEQWRAVSEGKRDRHSLKSMLGKIGSRVDVFPGSTGSSHVSRETENFSPPLSDQYRPERNEESAIGGNGKRLEEWVRAEAEKYASMIEQRHHIELDAFAEQMRLKDEKLEAFRWQLLRMELESKQLQSHMEGLIKDVTQLRHDKMKLESLLMEREEELSSLKEQFSSQLKSLNCHRNNLHSPLQSPELLLAQDHHHHPIWSKVNVVKRKPGGNEQEIKEIVIEEDCASNKQPLPSVVQSTESNYEEESDAVPKEGGPLSNQSPRSQADVVDTAEKIASASNTKHASPWKIDLHALGVSYKIKRLKQQLVLVERLTGKQANDENAEASDGGGRAGMKAYFSVTSLLNKQAGRYQSLQEKTDDLCKRMNENELYANNGGLKAARTKEETEKLGRFLEETFQLQRYIVATGQKLMEIQSKIVSGFVGVAEEMEKSAGIDMKRLADSIRNLFLEVQRGLEVRTARIIGDLEGTLACEGMIQWRR